MESSALSVLFSPIVITSVGGIVLAMIMAWVNYKISGNHINHSTQATKESAKAISDLSVNVAVNTEVMKSIRDIIDRKL